MQLLRKSLRMMYTLRFRRHTTFYQAATQFSEDRVQNSGGLVDAYAPGVFQLILTMQ